AVKEGEGEVGVLLRFAYVTSEDVALDVRLRGAPLPTTQALENLPHDLLPLVVGGQDLGQGAQGVAEIEKDRGEQKVLKGRIARGRGRDTIKSEVGRRGLVDQESRRVARGRISGRGQRGRREEVLSK
ncbi:unnamed protein product, partial [Discosporangium mesarthrocarpum]